MGWTETLAGFDSVGDFLEREYFPGFGERYEVIASKSVKSRGGDYNHVVYSAVRDLSDGHVFCDVALVDLCDSSVCYKSMHEGMGPVEAKCPKSILKLLSPTDDECTAKWRARCEENARAKDKRGPKA